MDKKPVAVTTGVFRVAQQFVSISRLVYFLSDTSHGCQHKTLEKEKKNYAHDKGMSV